jgi:MFS family permease
VGRLVLLRSVAKKDMVSAMSWLIMPALIGPILGPPLGGYIVTYLDWRWIFYVNLPVGVLGFVLVGRFIVNYREEHPHPFDPAGFALSGVSLGCLLFGCEMTSRPGGAKLAVPLLVVGTVVGILYIRHARRRADPIIDLGLLEDNNFRLSMIAGSLTRITQGSLPFLLPLMMQLGFGLSAAQSGTITVGPAIGSLLMKGVAPRLLRRVGFRTALIWAGILGAGGYAFVGLFRPGWPLPAIVAVLTVCGFIFSLQFTAYNAIAYDGIDKQRMSAATSFYSTVQQLMLSLGICIAASALHLSMIVHGVEKPAMIDFTAAFWIVTAISMSATIWNLRFARDAGMEISGRAPVAKPSSEARKVHRSA